MVNSSKKKCGLEKMRGRTLPPQSLPWLKGTVLPHEAACSMGPQPGFPAHIMGFVKAAVHQLTATRDQNSHEMPLPAESPPRQSDARTATLWLSAVLYNFKIAQGVLNDDEHLHSRMPWHALPSLASR